MTSGRGWAQWGTTTPCTVNWCKKSHLGRSGKSTHISMISNSVTYLWSYTTTPIANITGNSVPILPETPLERRYCHAEHWCRCAECLCLRIERRYRRIEWRVFMMFHNVLSVSWCFTSRSSCFTSGWRCFKIYHNVLQVFHDVLLCLTIFSQSRNDRRPPIGSGIATTPQGMPQGLVIMPQRSAISPRNWSHAKLHPEWRLD